MKLWLYKKKICISVRCWKLQLKTHLQSCSWQFLWSWTLACVFVCVCEWLNHGLCVISLCLVPALTLRQTGSQSNAPMTFQSRHANKLAASQTLTCQKTPYITPPHTTHTLLNRHTHLPSNHQKVPLQTHTESHKSKYKSLLPWTCSNNTYGFPSPLSNYFIFIYFFQLIDAS